MKLALIASILAAGCIAGPLAQTETESADMPEHTINYIDIAPKEFEPLKANLSSLVSRDTLPVSTCPAGQTYDRSVCYKANTIRSFCVANPRSNREKITDTPCKPQEICVQRRLNSGKSFAKCIPIVNLVEWKTSPVGNKEGCTTTSANPAGNHHLGTIVYDVNKNPIEVDKISYFGEPGNVNEGIGGSTSYFSSDLFHFSKSRFMKICIFSGGYGNLDAYTWLWE
uniref:Secreted in xylem 6 n=2 Tax=Fusarium oxysporum f. sp. pisi TaxID=179143 RepID=A0A7G5XAS6_FUSOX|nr:secreted in xylem 6 [Fusarium oxysporum f. sp. pisi]QNA42580.1 secreted in xylem 6 [Fusarium oxysporum f. sp. pisi]